MNLQINPDDFTYFVLLPEFTRRSSNGFKLAYDDKDPDGNWRFFEHKDSRGNVTKMSFNQAHRMIRVPIRNKELVEAIRRHPQCQDSPNGFYRVDPKTGKKTQADVLFKEINQNKDAEVYIDATMLKSEALYEAVQIIKDPEAAEDLALALGLTETDKQSYAKLLTIADSSPKTFLETLRKPDLKVRALVKKALRNDIFIQKGVFYYVGNISFGIDFDDIVKNVLTDNEKYQLLYKRVNGEFPTQKVDEVSSTTREDVEQKKKAGRPKKIQNDD